ncbi:MAG: zinc-ribbon domain containing protein [Bacteroidia bacterium]
MKKAFCPCCRQHVRDRETEQVLSLLPFNGLVTTINKPRREEFLETLKQHSGLYQWACDTCINTGKAILAQPSRQFYTFHFPWDIAIPYLAYFNKTLKCNRCGEYFTFSGEEQKYWYETLGFVVYSVPLQCASCRKEIRVEKSLNQELSDLLREGRPEEKEKLLRIAEIYQQMDKPEKAKAYLTAARKLKG